MQHFSLASDHLTQMQIRVCG